MTVKQFFDATTDLKCDDVVTIVDATESRILYHGPFNDVFRTVYAQYTVLETTHVQCMMDSFSQKSMYIKVL